MIKITLEFTSICAAVDALSSLKAHGYAAPAVNVSHVPEPAGNVTPAPKPGPVTVGKETQYTATATEAAAAQKAEASAPTASTEKPVESSAKGDTPAVALSYEKDVKPIVIKVGAAGKRDALVDLLKKFGVAKGPEVPADKLPAFKAELEALVA